METSTRFNNCTEYSSAYPILSSDDFTIHCSEVEEFLERLLEYRRNGAGTTTVFRGQFCEYWTLIATLFRPEFLAKQAIDSHFGKNVSAIDRSEYFDQYTLWEKEIALGFANDCMNEGIPLPNIPENPENDALDLDAVAAAAYFVARNQGIPNRLLDFTRSPTVAAWFASQSALKRNTSNSREKKMVVWAIRRDFLKFFGYSIVSTSWANAQIPQMQRQKAVLLVDDRAKQNFQETGLFQPMEYMIENYLKNLSLSPELARRAICRFTLPHHLDIELQYKLYDYELSEIHLFPTIERIAKSTLEAYDIHARSSARMYHVARKIAEERQRDRHVDNFNGEVESEDAD